MNNKNSSSSFATMTTRPSFASSIPEEKQESFVFPRFKNMCGQRKMFNFNRYSTIKSIGIGLLIAAMTVQTAIDIKRIVHMEKAEKKVKLPVLGLLVLQLAILVTEKSLLIFMGLANVQNPARQRISSRANIISSILLTLTSILQIITHQMLADHSFTASKA